MAVYSPNISWKPKIYTVTYRNFLQNWPTCSNLNSLKDLSSCFSLFGMLVTQWLTSETSLFIVFHIYCIITFSWFDFVTLPWTCPLQIILLDPGSRYAFPSSLLKSSVLSTSSKVGLIVLHSLPIYYHSKPRAS